MEIRELGEHDVDAVLAAGHLFDSPPRRDWAADFLARDGHHLLLASVEGVPAGFATGIETIHPDKGTELLLYELGVDAGFRRRGIGRRLVEAMLELARERGCSGMWVPIESDDAAAVATYRSAGAADPVPAATMSWDLTDA